jgi:hypothetical protein
MPFFIGSKERTDIQRENSGEPGQEPCLGRALTWRAASTGPLDERGILVYDRFVPIGRFVAKM